MLKSPPSGQRRARTASPGEPPQRRSRTEQIGALLPEVGGMAFRRFGFAQGALIKQWPQIVGLVYARWCIPQSIRFPRGSKSRGTLTILVEGPYCTQLQHVAPQIIERVNRVLGLEAVAKIRLLQGDVPKPAAPADMPEPASHSTTGNVCNVADDRLRAALESLAGGLETGGAWTTDAIPKIR